MGRRAARGAWLIIGLLGLTGCGVTGPTVGGPTVPPPVAASPDLAHLAHLARLGGHAGRPAIQRRHGRAHRPGVRDDWSGVDR